MLNDPMYLTSREVGALVRVSSRTVERWALEDSTMPVTRIGRLLRFERGALLVWLARHSTQRSTRAVRAPRNLAITQDKLTVIASAVA